MTSSILMILSVSQISKRKEHSKMGKIMNEKLRICRIDTNGSIPELGHIQGPVRKCRLNTKQIKLLVSNGRAVYELNPANTKEEKKLTITNCTTPQFEKDANVVEVQNTPQEVIPPITGDIVEPKEVEQKSVDVEPVKSSDNNSNKNKYDKYNKNKNNEPKKDATEKLTSADIQ